MPTRPKNAYEDKIYRYNLAIHNALNDPAVLTLISACGYDAKTLQEGKDLLEAVQLLFQEQKRKYGDQMRLTRQCKDTWAEVNKTFMRTRKLIRIVFGNDAGICRELMLTGPKKKDTPGWISQVSTMYDAVLRNPGYIEKLAIFNYTKDKLEAERALLDTVKQRELEKEYRKTEARKATRKRDDMMRKLTSWMSVYRRVLRIALEDDAQLLEQLGIVARSE